MNSEFKRMQTLAGIVTENDLYEEEGLDFSDLKKLAPELEKVLVAAKDEVDKKRNKEGKEALEEVLSPEEIAIAMNGLMFIAAPGLVKATLRIVNMLIKKAPKGFNLYKNSGKETKLEWLEAFAGKLDDYLDIPFRFMLRPFIKDAAQRKRYAKVFKVIAVALASIVLGVNLASSSAIKDIIQRLLPEGGEYLLKSTTTENLTVALKAWLTKKGI